MNPWIAHVQQYAKDHNMTYFQALRDPKVKEGYKGAPVKGAPSKTVKGEEDYTTKKTSKVFHEKGKYVRKDRKPFQKKRIDFSKIHWGELTKDWKEMGSPKESLYDFATDVLKRPSEYPAITVKRARFYKNILVKGKGLGMC